MIPLKRNRNAASERNNLPDSIYRVRFCAANGYRRCIMTPQNPTHRVPPVERFAADEREFDLQAVVTALRSERRLTAAGHQQQVLYRRGDSTLAVFAFDAGAELVEHSAPGMVVLQGLEGHLTIRTPETDYELTPGKVVALAPDVAHSVHADEQSAMLLTVAF